MNTLITNKPLLTEICKQLETNGVFPAGSCKVPTRAIDPSVDGVLELRISENESRVYVVGIKRPLTTQNFESTIQTCVAQSVRLKMPSLVVSDYINPNLAERLRERKIEFVDSTGNAYLHGTAFHIDIRGRKPKKKPAARGLGSAKAIQLIGLLLAEHSAIKGTTRQLSANAGISLGSTSQILKELKSRGYLEKTGRKDVEIVRRADLLDHWAAGYANTLRPKIFRQSYKLSPRHELTNLLQLLDQDKENNVLVGGELAAAAYSKYLNPSQATLHTFDGDLHFQPGTLIPDVGGNIDVVSGFGNLSNWSGEYFIKNGFKLAHPLLVYGELLKDDQPNRRLGETAEIIRSGYNLESGLPFDQQDTCND